MFYRLVRSILRNIFNIEYEPTKYTPVTEVEHFLFRFSLLLSDFKIIRSFYSCVSK